MQPGYRFQIAAVALIVLTAVVALTLQGRVWWCDVGDLWPWSWQVWSRHNSQHLIDPYSFTHILHGVLEFWLIGLVFRKMPIAWRVVLAIFIESSWEVAENTNYIINRYRETTISLDYYGDPIANSISDIVCCGLGLVGDRVVVLDKRQFAFEYFDVAMATRCGEAMADGGLGVWFLVLICKKLAKRTKA